jgi:hypothetical protein
MGDDAEDRIIGTAEAAELLGWSQRKLQRKLHTGQIDLQPIQDAVGHRKEYLFLAADVIAVSGED